MNLVRARSALLLSLSLGVAACREPPPPLAPAASPSAGRAAAAPSVTGSPAASSPPIAAVAAPSGAGEAPSPARSVVVPSPSASVGLPPLAAAPPAPPPLLDGAGAPLPQTEERPRTDSAWFEDLGPALWRAILADDPNLALPHFFPVVAYEQVKAIAKPARDWETRLVRLFGRDVHRYHQQLGPERDRLRFEALEVPDARATFMKPGSEGNRLGYWRVLRSQLVYRDVRDRALRLEVTSLISWRGEWYVVHLHGFE